MARTLSSDKLAAIARTHRGRLYCFTAWDMETISRTWGLTVVRDGERGHYPLYEEVFMGSRREALAESERLNRDVLKLPLRTVQKLLTGSCG